MVSTSPSTVRRCYAICIVTCRSLLSGSSLGGEVGLGGKSASISGFLATAGIFGVSKLGSMTNMERGVTYLLGVPRKSKWIQSPSHSRSKHGHRYIRRLDEHLQQGEFQYGH